MSFCLKVAKIKSAGSKKIDKMLQYTYIGHFLESVFEIWDENFAVVVDYQPSKFTVNHVCLDLIFKKY